MRRARCFFALETGRLENVPTRLWKRPSVDAMEQLESVAGSAAAADEITPELAIVEREPVPTTARGARTRLLRPQCLLGYAELRQNHRPRGADPCVYVGGAQKCGLSIHAARPLPRA